MLGLLRFRVRATAEEGEAPFGIFEQSGRPLASFTLQIAPGSPARTGTFRPESFTGGPLTVLAPTGPRPVADLSCAQFLDRVQLRFAATEAYDEIEVRRDGEPVATLAGDATGYDDPLEDFGLTRYEVAARRGGEASFPTPCELLAVTPAAPAVENLSCDSSGIGWSNWFDPTADGLGCAN